MEFAPVPKILSFDNVLRLPEFKGVVLDDAVVEYISNVTKSIIGHNDRINNILTGHGFSVPAKIRLGPELEIFNIGGHDAFKRRLKAYSSNYAKALDQATDQEGNVDVEKLSDLFEAALGKDDSFMPKAARAEFLNEAFAKRVRKLSVFQDGQELYKRQHVTVDKEPAYHPQFDVDRRFPVSSGGRPPLNFEACFQHEIISPPRSPLGCAYWLKAIQQRIISESKNYGLVRTEIISVLPNMAASGIHIHMSLLAAKDGAYVNLMERDTFPNEKKRSKANQAIPSSLALHIAHAINEVMSWGFYILAPTETAYQRFSNRQPGAPSFIGFTERRQRFNMGTAMIRGGGRNTFREGDANGKSDTGPLRLEVRGGSVESLGHPNSKHYHRQATASLDVVDLFMLGMRQGVESWHQDQQRANPSNMTEDGLYGARKIDIPKSPGLAAIMLREAAAKGKGGFTEERAKFITRRGHEHQIINDLDHRPNHPSGQDLDRNELLRREWLSLDQEGE